MDIVGVIAEFDPFHNGHAYLFRQIRQSLPDSVIAVALSGSITQRGEVAAVSKFARARMALDAGADLVFLLPVTFACASAERFARGGVGLLRELGVTVLAFGSESGDLSLLQQAADALEDPAYPECLRKELKQGISFAQARENAVREIVGDPAEVLRHPNDILAVEYLQAIRGTGIRPMAVPRQGEDHDSPSLSGDIVSAAAIRTLLFQGEIPSACGKMPPDAAELLQNLMKSGTAPAQLKNGETVPVLLLRLAREERFAELPDVSEGLEHRLYRAARTADSVEEFCSRVKTKRYSYARIRRIVMWNCLGVRKQDCPDQIPFLQLLAVSPAGQKLLRCRKKSLSVPLVSRPAAGLSLKGEAEKQFRLECGADDLWGMCCPAPKPRGWSLIPQVYRGKEEKSEGDSSGEP